MLFYLWLASDDDENKESLQAINQVRQIPELLRSSDSPRNDVQDPCYAHHDDQFHAHPPKRSPAIGKFFLINFGSKCDFKQMKYNNIKR